MRLRQVGVQPVGDVLRQRREDHLVELAVVQRLLDRVHRVVT